MNPYQTAIDGLEIIEKIPARYEYMRILYETIPQSYQARMFRISLQRSPWVVRQLKTGTEDEKISVSGRKRLLSPVIQVASIGGVIHVDNGHSRLFYFLHANMIALHTPNLETMHDTFGIRVICLINEKSVYIKLFPYNHFDIRGKRVTPPRERKVSPAKRVPFPERKTLW